MVKALVFKGDKKPPKKRKREKTDDDHAEDGNQVVRADTSPEDDMKWVSADTVADISGPIMLVLATKPVTCIAVDQLGKVFASNIENMVDGEPNSAEPHDVRQVWIAQKIPGSEDRFTLKGHHGRLRIRTFSSYAESRC